MNGGDRKDLKRTFNELKNQNNAHFFLWFKIDHSWRICSNWYNGSWRLLHDTALSYRVAVITDFLSKNLFFLLENSPCSPDFALCDCFLFPNLHLAMEGNRFTSIEYKQPSTGAILNSIPINDKNHVDWKKNVWCMTFWWGLLVSSECSSSVPHSRYEYSLFTMSETFLKSIKNRRSGNLNAKYCLSIIQRVSRGGSKMKTTLLSAN